MQQQWPKWTVPAAVIAVVSAFALVLFAINHASGETVEALPVLDHTADWVLICRVTGKGERDGSETFTGPRVMAHPYITRRGTRVWAPVQVMRSSKTVPAGFYDVHGTVVSVDIEDRRATLTDCVFVRR